MIGFGTRFATEQRSRQPIWLVTFTDIVALLLAFFVMLFATQRVDRAKWEALVGALSRAPDVSVVEGSQKSDATAPTIAVVPAVDLSYLEALLIDSKSQSQTLADARLRRFDDRLVLALPTDLLFPAGRAELTADARTVLFELGGILEKIGNQIAIHGHTDPRPVGRSSFASNWELSIARALAVANYLKSAGYQREPAALGKAATEYSDVVSGLPPDTAYALARRVDIVFFHHSWIDK